MKKLVLMKTRTHKSIADIANALALPSDVRKLESTVLSY